MGRFIDLTGLKFSRLTVIGRVENNNRQNKPRWLCECDCGGQTQVDGSLLKNGNTKSCGCLNKDNQRKRLTKHSMSYSKTYKIYQQMVQRCYNVRCKEYCRYGKRGIKVCDRWLNKKSGFINFLADMGECPPGLSLDRIKNDKLINAYSPKNCRWATTKEQGRNKRTTIKLNIDNEIISLSELAEKNNIKLQTLRSRINRGMPIEKALNKPANIEGENNGRSKINSWIVRIIRRLLAQKYLKQKEIADIFRVSISVVNKINLNKTYKETQ